MSVQTVRGITSRSTCQCDPLGSGGGVAILHFGLSLVDNVLFQLRQNLHQSLLQLIQVTYWLPDSCRLIDRSGLLGGHNYQDTKPSVPWRKNSMIIERARSAAMPSCNGAAVSTVTAQVVLGRIRLLTTISRQTNSDPVCQKNIENRSIWWSYTAIC